MILISSLPDDLKPIKVTREDVCRWYKVEMLRMFSLHSQNCFIHIILSTKSPAAWKMVHLLVSVHFCICLELSTVNIEEYIPVGSICPNESIELQSIDNAFVLLSCESILQVLSFYGYHFVQVVLDSDAVGIAEEYGRWTMQKHTLPEISFAFCRGIIVNIFTLINGFVVFFFALGGSTFQNTHSRTPLLHAFVANLLNFVKQLAISYGQPRILDFFVHSNGFVHSVAQVTYR